MPTDRLTVVGAMLDVTERSRPELEALHYGRIVLPGETPQHDEYETLRAQAFGLKELYVTPRFEGTQNVTDVMGRTCLEAGVASLMNLRPASGADVRRCELNGITREMAPFVAAAAAKYPRDQGDADSFRDPSQVVVRSHTEQLRFVTRHAESFSTLLEVSRPTYVGEVDNFIADIADFLGRITVDSQKRR
jgi:hypothetical protein